MSKRVAIKKEREAKADAELWHTSSCLLKSGEEHEVGCVHQFRASLAFTAFALEAYLNHVGYAIFKCWPSIEKKMSPSDKLKLICERLKIETDWASRPWQTVKALMRYRNWVAHGRGEHVVEEYEDTVDHYGKRFYDMPLTKWEKFGTQEYAKRAREDVEEIARRVHEKGGDPADYPFSPGSITGAAGPPKSG